MELSTTMPVANARPARLMTLMLRLNTDIIKNVPTILMGMARARISVLLALRKNNSNTIIARVPPINRLLRTNPMALLM